MTIKIHCCPTQCRHRKLNKWVRQNREDRSLPPLAELQRKNPVTSFWRYSISCRNRLQCAEGRECVCRQCEPDATSQWLQKWVQEIWLSGSLQVVASTAMCLQPRGLLYPKHKSRPCASCGQKQLYLSLGFTAQWFLFCKFRTKKKPEICYSQEGTAKLESSSKM